MKTTEDNSACKHCGTRWEFHDGISVTCSNLEAERAKFAALRAKVLKVLPPLIYHGCRCGGGCIHCNGAALVKELGGEMPTKAKTL